MNDGTNGEITKPIAMILHGGGLGPWSEKKLGRYLSRDFRVLMPTLDGHAGSAHPFTSIRDNALHILSWLDDEHIEKLSLIAGLSLGGAVALELITLRPELTESAIIESTDLVKSHMPISFMKASIGMSWPLTKKRRFAKLRSDSLHLPEDLFEDYFRDTSSIRKEDAEEFITAAHSYSPSPGLIDTGTRVAYVYGGKENRSIKKSAVKMKEMLPSSLVTEIPGLRHGEASIKLHAIYADLIRGMS